MARVCEALWHCVFVGSGSGHLSNNIDSTVTKRFKQDPAVGTFQSVERYVPHLCAMEDISYGSISCIIGPFLTTDDASMLRTVTSRWNVGNTGYAFFMMLKL